MALSSRRSLPQALALLLLVCPVFPCSCGHMSGALPIPTENVRPRRKKKKTYRTTQKGEGHSSPTKRMGNGSTQKGESHHTKGRGEDSTAKRRAAFPPPLGWFCRSPPPSMSGAAVLLLLLGSAAVSLSFLFGAVLFWSENQNYKGPVQKTHWRSRTSCRKFW